MPDNQQAPSEGANANPAFRMFRIFLVFVVVVLALALGKTWKERLHWTGEVLLITGILLAAEGISQVRREWTQRPGIWGHVKQLTEGTRVRTAGLIWKSWNWVAKALHLPLHERSVTVRAGVAMAKASVSGAAVVTWGPPPVTGTTEERLTWLENHMADAGQQLRTLHALHAQGVAATEEERAVRVVEDQRIRERMADLAGGGLRLQAWGVVCLLAGTLMTAIW